MTQRARGGVLFRFAFYGLAVAALSFGPVLAQSEGTTDTDLAVDETLTPADPEASREAVSLPADSGSGEPPFYAIRPGDTLTISVLEDPNLTRTVLVRPDGRVSLPIAGSVVVAGFSPEDLERLLSERFARGFQITPTVTVSIRGLAPLARGGGGGERQEPTRYYLLGSIGRRGPIDVPEPLTILEVLALAGGPTPFAASDRIQIRRIDENGVETIMMFNFRALEDGELIQNNILLEAGDIVFVPERGLFD